MLWWCDCVWMLMWRLIKKHLILYQNPHLDIDWKRTLKQTGCSVETNRKTYLWWCLMWMWYYERETNREDILILSQNPPSWRELLHSPAWLYKDAKAGWEVGMRVESKRSSTVVKSSAWEGEGKRERRKRHKMSKVFLIHALCAIFL